MGDDLMCSGRGDTESFGDCTAIKKAGVQARVRPEKTPRYSSQSLGTVGSMQAMFMKQVRILKTDLETKIKTHLFTSMAVRPWLVRHSSWLVERYPMRANGRTSYQDCFGTVYLHGRRVEVR